jgi:hypothetical protein
VQSRRNVGPKPQNLTLVNEYLDVRAYFEIGQMHGILEENPRIQHKTGGTVRAQFQQALCSNCRKYIPGDKRKPCQPQ